MKAIIEKKSPSMTGRWPSATTRDRSVRLRVSVRVCQGRSVEFDARVMQGLEFDPSYLGLLRYRSVNVQLGLRAEVDLPVGDGRYRELHGVSRSVATVRRHG